MTPHDGARLLARAITSHRERSVHAIADRHAPAIKAAVTYAFARGRQAVDRKALRSMTTVIHATRATAGAADAVKAALRKTLPAALWKTFVASGEASLEKLKGMKALALRAAKQEAKPKLVMAFDSENERAIAWAEEHAAELIDDLSDTTKQAITNAIVRGFESGSKRDVSSEVLDALFEDEVLGAVGDEARAEMIAKTESMRAANGGQREGWNQAVENGLLTGDERRVWIATEVGACPQCEALDGQTADLDGEYPDEGGEGPPAHPSCRCTEGLQP